MGNSGESGFRGMAPTPEALLKLREAREEEIVYSHVLKNTSPLAISQVKQAIRSIFWQYQKRILDLVEVSTPSDRQWTTMRRVMQDIQNEQLEHTNAVVGQIMYQEMYSGESGEPGSASGSEEESSTSKRNRGH